jgi:hypothetical protein
VGTKGIEEATGITGILLLEGTLVVEGTEGKEGLNT